MGHCSPKYGRRLLIIGPTCPRKMASFTNKPTRKRWNAFWRKLKQYGRDASEMGPQFRNLEWNGYCSEDSWKLKIKLIRPLKMKAKWRPKAPTYYFTKHANKWPFPMVKSCLWETPRNICRNNYICYWNTSQRAPVPKERALKSSAESTCKVPTHEFHLSANL